MIFICFHHHEFNNSWKYFEVLQMAQPHVIFWWSVIGISCGGAKERIIVSLIITSFVSACLDTSKPPSSGEAMISLCNCRMKHYSKSSGTIHFTLDSSSVISKVSHDIGDSRTFECFIIHSTYFCVNALLNCFSRTMHGLIDHFNSVFWTWAIKCPRFVGAFFPNNMRLICYIEINP